MYSQVVTVFWPIPSQIWSEQPPILQSVSNTQLWFEDPPQKVDKSTDSLCPVHAVIMISGSSANASAFIIDKILLADLYSAGVIIITMKKNEIFAVLSLVFSITFFVSFLIGGSVGTMLAFMLPLLSMGFGYIGFRKNKSVYRRISLIGFIVGGLELLSVLYLFFFAIEYSTGLVK